MKGLRLTKQMDPAVLWQLFQRTARSYTQGDSATLPQEVAEELLRSLCFTLDTFGISADDALLMLDAAQRALEEKTHQVQQLWRYMCESTPDLPSDALRSSLYAVGTFFQHYDQKHFAHEIPCLIDYPAAIIVPDGLLGICWIERYLLSLQAENRLLCAFPEKQICRLMDLHCPAWRISPVNLCLPVLSNALANVALYGRHSLLLSQADLWTIREINWPQQMDGAVRTLGKRLNASDEQTDYLLATSRELLPRILTGAAEGIFTCI